MPENRVYNFSAGPSMLPEEVLKQAASEMLNYNRSGMSVMEMSHRSKVYEEIIAQAESSLRQLMNIPDDYTVLFLQGGATSQFAMVPMNLLNVSGVADYIVTGQFSGNAYKEAKKYGTINLAATSEDKNFTYIPQQNELKLSDNADYLHICRNNTIFGSLFNYIPQTNAPVVCDMSSCILSEEVDVSKYGVIYAGAQKNMGPAGLTVVIIKNSLLGKVRDYAPAMFDYALMAKNQSMYNTPPTYAIYISKLVTEWVIAGGGLKAIEQRNKEKAALLYDFIDESSLFKAPVLKPYRSMMNVTFVTGNAELDDAFCKDASKAGFVNIKGHRSVGGMRASIYNAMPYEGIRALVEFMKDFELKNK